MAEIHLLSDEIINKIAAGEVIERPASAVKELIENAIDAGATRIQVQIEQGGKKKIQVTDNGKGMGAADLDLCYLRHTTSKLTNADDLFHLHTNGFRGEAVASIAAVSKLTITSATQEGESGRIIVKGGEVIEKEDIQASRGTTFLVEDLFYNTPVRRTFLGSETSECSRILDIVLKTAISHPEIRFDYKVGDRTVFTGVPGELRSRIAEAIGSKVAKGLLPVDYTEAGVHVTGYISPTTETNGKRNHQFLFMRNRPIENKMVSKAVSQAYEPYGAQCKPVTVLFLDMPDMEFDINVHPAKREVRFANGNLVFLVVTHAIRDTFTKDLEAHSPIIDLSDEFMGGTTPASQTTPAQPAMPETPAQPQNDLPWENPFQQAKPYAAASQQPIQQQARPSFASKPYAQPAKPVNSLSDKKSKYDVSDDVQDLFSLPEYGKIISLEPDHSKPAPPPETPWAPPSFFQIANTYIAGEDSNGLLIIDQHAAHTRVLFEQAMESLQNNIMQDSQELLFPELIDLSKQEKEIFRNVDEQLRKLGFFVEPFGGDTYQIRSIPSALPLSRAAKAVHDFLNDVDENDTKNDMVKFQEAIAKSWAKTNAYQAGDKLKPEEITALVGQLMITQDPLKSPFGSPTLMRLTLEELSKKFRH
ncbi:DNA mismatch repair protein MutL [Fibrobacter succinogenes subsp. succinogenes S85]|uniref:DNA mismatch repair protein MutL n=1 Tax=Fibrobacter succinogenes (strain ATCC 19169 / S85) TaxID=59374 RepID=A0ABM5LFH4_FIBSS|nr:DNA mismatch repair endonuclease MutL [Fibrobacter succinogenes]ACX74296.1 DNA mismatch repair protein MutL [Fibrobacter succinogenes subsp. succinogenes S85]